MLISPRNILTVIISVHVAKVAWGDDAKCAEEIGAPVKCVAPLKGLVNVIIDGMDGSCPTPIMLDWFKDLKNIQDKCLGKPPGNVSPESVLRCLRLMRNVNQCLQVL